MYGISITYYVLYAGNAGMKVHVSNVAEKLIMMMPKRDVYCPP